MKRISWILAGMFVIVISYYLFLRSFEYEVNFKAHTLPGDLIQTIRIWNGSLDNAHVVNVDSFYRLKQAVIWKNRSYDFNWNFELVNDSVTAVNVQISEPGRRTLNKLLIPITHQQIEGDAGEIVRNFYQVLTSHLKITKVKVIGKAEIDSSFCLCRSLETSQIGKANGMMKDFPLLNSFIEQFKLESKGPPIVQIRAWDHSRGLLKYDFCFPIVYHDSLPVLESVIYKKIKKETVLKASYFGNYITSDRAWYELIQYAQKNGYKVNGFPIEQFHDNPNLGSNEGAWKADVYLPIAD